MKRSLALLASVSLAVGVAATVAAPALADTPATYWDPVANAAVAIPGTAQALPDPSASGVTLLGADSTSSWYLCDANSPTSYSGGSTSGGLAVAGDVNLVLAAGCALTSSPQGIGIPGIAVLNGNSLTIWGVSADAGGSGSLSVKASPLAAGIGSDGSGPSGSVTVNGGTLTATGGSSSAGIGGSQGDGGAVTVNGGVVTATGGAKAAGIGGGFSGYGGSLTVTGGTVVAIGGDQGPGIGGGFGGDGQVSGGTVDIAGGTVRATGGGNGAGIGGGYGGNGGTVNISGGAVTATGGAAAAGIGSGSGYSFYASASSGDVAITGDASVTAHGGSVNPDSTADGRAGLYANSAGAGIGGGGASGYSFGTYLPGTVTGNVEIATTGTLDIAGGTGAVWSGSDAASSGGAGAAIGAGGQAAWDSADAANGAAAAWLVTSQADGHGTVYPRNANGEPVTALSPHGTVAIPAGNSITYSVVPGAGYQAASATVTGGASPVDVTAAELASGTYTLNNVESNLALAVEFTRIPGAPVDQAALVMTDPGSKTAGDGPFALVTTGGSGTGAVSFTSSDPSVLSINGDTATIHHAGTVLITAVKAGDADYIPATATLSLTINPATDDPANPPTGNPTNPPTGNPTTDNPATDDPANPPTDNPATDNPASGNSTNPATGNPATANPATDNPSTGDSSTGDPAHPTTGDPATGNPATGTQPVTPPVTPVLSVGTVKAVYGTAYPVPVAVRPATASGSVTVKSGRVVLGSARLNAGKAVVTVDAAHAVLLSAGVHTLTVSYSGTATVPAVSKSIIVGKAKSTVTVKAAKATSKARKAKISVSVKAGVAKLGAAKITVRTGGKVIATGKLKAGKGTVSITLKKLAAKGKHTLSVTYPGNANVLAGKKTVKIVIG